MEAKEPYLLSQFTKVVKVFNTIVLFELQVDVEIIPNCGSNTGITDVMMCAGFLAGGKDSCQVWSHGL